MKVLTTVVETCDQCPCFTPSNNMCGKTYLFLPEINADYEIEIPEWCPLEDAKEDKEDV